MQSSGEDDPSRSSTIDVLPAQYQMSVPGEDSSIAACMCLDAARRLPPAEMLYCYVSGGEDDDEN